MYDAIVVGARCAGAPTAMLLARQGYRVLLIDQAEAPSDHSDSTDLIWPAGVARLARWGLLERLRATNCPPLSTVRFDIGPLALTGSVSTVWGQSRAYAPRRSILTRLLLDAAQEAGVTLRQSCQVDETILARGRVVGVRGRTGDGSTLSARARVVVGADGFCPAPTPPRAETAPRQGAAFAYWSGVPVDGVELYLQHCQAVRAWKTNDSFTFIAVHWNIADPYEASPDREERYLAVLHQVAPGLADRLAQGARVSPWGGGMWSAAQPAESEDWVPVGEASVRHELFNPWGVDDAFRQAELLVEALEAGLSGRVPLDEVLADYRRRRAEIALPLDELAALLASPAPLSPATLRRLERLWDSSDSEDAAPDRLATHQTLGRFPLHSPAWFTADPFVAV